MSCAPMHWGQNKLVSCQLGLTVSCRCPWKPAACPTRSTRWHPTCRHPIWRLRWLDASSDLTNPTPMSWLSVFNFKTRETQPEQKSIQNLAIFSKFQLLFHLNPSIFGIINTGSGRTSDFHHDLLEISPDPMGSHRILDGFGKISLRFGRFWLFSVSLETDNLVIVTGQLCVGKLPTQSSRSSCCKFIYSLKFSLSSSTFTISSCSFILIIFFNISSWHSSLLDL